MIPVKAWVLGLVSLWLLSAGLALSSNCTNNQCAILVLDAPFFETVYDRERLLTGQTNADAICDILRRAFGSRVKLMSRSTNPLWFNDISRFKEATSADPDLILLHTSAFYSSWSDAQTIQNLVTGLRYLADISRAKFLIYGTNFYLIGGAGWFRESLVNAVPQVKDRVSIVELSARSFEVATSAREISQGVAQVLDLGN